MELNQENADYHKKRELLKIENDFKFNNLNKNKDN